MALYMALYLALHLAPDLALYTGYLPTSHFHAGLADPLLEL